MKILCAGGRNYRDSHLPEIALNLLYEWARLAGEPLIVIHGDAPGLDRIVRKWTEWAQGEQMAVAQKPYPARWDLFGKRAGPLRNQAMIDQENLPSSPIDLGLVFPDPDSTGTYDCAQRMCEVGIPVWMNEWGQPLSSPPKARLVPSK